MKINTPTMWFRQVNAQFPWLKVVLLVSFVSLMSLGIGQVIKHDAAEPANIEVSEHDANEQPTENSAGIEINGETQPSTPESAEESTEPKPEDESTSTESKPEVVQPAPSQSAAQPREVASGRKLIALTFDDGPSNATTPRLLDILQQKGVKVTFFVVGTRAQSNPALLKREVNEGHEVGSHSFDHANLIKLSAAQIQGQVDQMNTIFQNAIGTTPKLMRPPYGSINQTVRNVIPQPMILWTIDPEDWKYKDAVKVRQKSVEGAFDGAILLLHDIHSTTVDAVPGIIDDLKAQGYEFLTVSEMAAQRGKVLERGVAYGSFRP